MNAEKLDVSYIAHGNLTWYSKSKKHFEIFKSKTEHATIIQTSNYPPKNFS